MARKRHRIPEVLRRTFGDRARTLGETILSLSPKPPPKQVECLCRGRGCVRCGGSSFLLRQEDGPDYRQLLNRCFCVVSPGAPELTDLCYRGEWTQRLIVRYTVESLIGRSHSYDNVLRKGYDEQSRISLNGEFLCDPAWNLLLTRIGESAMTFLLKYSSIFIPLPTNNHHQVAGPLLNKVLQSLNLSHKPAIPILPSKYLQTLSTGDHIDNGCESKGKKRKFEAKQKIFPPSNHHGESVEVQNKYYDVYGKPQKYVGPFNWKQYKKIRCMKVMEGSILKDPLDMNTNEGESNTLLQRRCSMCLSFHSHSLNCRDMSDITTQKPALDSHKSVLMPRVQSAKGDMKMESDSSTVAHLGPVISPCFQTNSEYFASPAVGICSTSEVFAKSRKRKRLYSWQRHTRRKKRNTLDRSNSRSSIINDKESSSSFLQWEPDLHCELPEQMTKINYPIIKKKYKETNQYSTDIAIPNLLEDGVIHCETFNREQNVKHLNPNMASTCFNCLMLRSTPKISGRAEIRKKSMFYNSGSSSSVLPGNHIINRLKPNNSGAFALLKDIFYVSGGGLDTYHAFFLHGKNRSSPVSGCLYHSLLRILKTLIRNAHKCQFMGLLRKHCPVLNLLGISDSTGQISEAAEKNTVIEKKLKKKFLGLHKTSENIHSEFLYAGTKKVNHLKQSLHESNSVDRGFLAAETKSYCEHKEVVSFIWAATRSIVPVDLLGDYSNWRSLRRNISKFVRLRRFETFCLRQCVNRLQTSKFSFLSRIPNRPLCYCFSKEGSTMVKDCWESKDDWIVLKHKLFHGWIFWFFSCMVVPMLGANFYVTESEFGKHEALYYPKPVWTTLLARTMSCLKKQNYCPIDLKYFAKITSSRPFGFSKVRFLPKEKGMRLLANLKAPSKAWLLAKSSFCDHIAKTSDKSITRLKGRNSNRKLKLVHFRSVNSALHDVHAILKRIKSEHPLMVGASVFDYNDVYQVLYGFLARLKNGSTTVPKVFIVVADVSKAFDSINQDRLLDVMKDVIWKKEYLLRKYAQVICTKKTMSTRYGYVCVDRNEDHDIANSLTSIRSCSSHGIITDQGILKKIKHAEIHHLLREHVKSNILQLGRDFCLQRSGISQGSLLSSLLCSFYYGHLERSIIFPFLRKIPQLPHASSSSSNAKEPAIEGVARDDGNTEDHSSPQHILLRLVDDFLFISSSEKQASGFFNRLCRGFREYNCYMNSEKFGLNFDVGGKSQPRSNRRYVGADGIPFLPWSGLLVNCLTLEIQADYTRYLGSHLRSTLTVHAHAKVGEHLGEKLCNYMRPKCHPLFYDSYINSPAVVRLNAYQAFLLCAMKFHSYLRALPNCRLGPSRCLEIIQRSFSYMHRLIKKRMYGVGRRKLDFVPALRLKKVETVWLGLSAYIRVLRKKQSRHGELLLLLGGVLEGLGRLEGCDPSHLEYAVDDSHSSLFWQIKY